MAKIYFEAGQEKEAADYINSKCLEFYEHKIKGGDSANKFECYLDVLNFFQTTGQITFSAEVNTGTVLFEIIGMEGVQKVVNRLIKMTTETQRRLGLNRRDFKPQIKKSENGIGWECEIQIGKMRFSKRAMFYNKDNARNDFRKYVIEQLKNTRESEVEFLG